MQRKNIQRICFKELTTEQNLTLSLLSTNQAVLNQIKSEIIYFISITIYTTNGIKICETFLNVQITNITQAPSERVKGSFYG